MPKVLIFKETLLPPSETFIRAQSSALQRYDWILAGLERSQPSLPFDREPLLLSETPGRPAALRAKLYRRIGFAPGFHRTAREFAPDLIHAHFASGGRTALPLARALHVPMIVTLHGADITVKGAAERYAELSKFASRFLCVSEFIREKAISAGIPSSKLTVHYIGIDRTLFEPSQEQPNGGVLFVGRLVEKKGCEYLLRAMQIVQREHAEASLNIIGDGPLRESLQTLAKQLAIKCKFFGTLQASDVRREMQRTSILCIPSVTAANGDSEGLPMVLAEAQACGIPVVGTRHAGIPEIIQDEQTGLLVAERDTSSLANAISRLLTDSALCYRFRQAGIARIAQRFDLKSQTALLEDLYDSVISSTEGQESV